MHMLPMLLEILTCNFTGYQIGLTQRCQSSEHGDEFLCDVSYTRRGMVVPGEYLVGCIGGTQKSQFTVERLNHWWHAFSQLSKETLKRS